jgi:hypothetical protein
VFCSEDGPNVVSIPYTLKLLCPPFTYGIYIEPRGFSCFSTTAALGINDRVNETLGIAVQLKIMSEVCLLMCSLFL